jgi:hypothetical protein
MGRLLRALRNHVPRRRRRFWRYVSPRRHGVGVTTLALVLGLIYVYWYLTNEGRIRRQAEQYLRDLTRGIVKIESASFSLFGNVELRGVSVYLPSDEFPGPSLTARAAVLPHRPWSLFVTGRLHPAEVICMNPVVNYVYYGEGEPTNIRRWLMYLADTRRDAARGEEARAFIRPPIRFRQGELRVFQKVGQRWARQGTWSLGMSMLAKKSDPEIYVVSFEEVSDAPTHSIHGKLEFNVVTGQLTHIEDIAIPGRLPIEALPENYRNWLRRYAITGDFHARGDFTGGKREFTVHLSNVSLKLPPGEGGLALRDVSGTLVFDAEGVAIQRVAGAIEEIPGARFEMSGRYAGYDKRSPFTITASMEGMTLPEEGAVAGDLAGIVEEIRRLYAPSGTFALDVMFRRDAQEDVCIKGAARPSDMSILYRHFPYRVSDLKGRIDFTESGVTGFALSARKGCIRLKGTMRGSGSDWRLTAHVTGRDIPFDENLKGALPRDYLTVWKMLSPAGSADFEVDIRQAAGQRQPDVDVHLAMDGQASMMYSGFPYRLERMSGLVVLAGNRATISSVRARRGDMRCVINGTIVNTDKKRPNVSLAIVADDLPLDAALMEALGGSARKALASLHPGGTARTVRVSLTQSESQPLRHHIVAELKDATFCYEGFPYPVTKARGVLTIAPERVQVEREGRVRGVHGKTPVEIWGVVSLHGEEKFAVDLHICSDGMELDEDLYAALPSKVQDVWRLLSPAGTAGVRMRIWHKDAQRQPGGELMYRVELSPIEMEVTYRDFPLTLRRITGRAIATPGRIELTNLASRDETRHTSNALSGTIASGEGRDVAELTVSAENLPIDAQLLEAMPAALSPLTKRFRPGGTCSVDLKTLRIARRHAEATSRPASSPAVVKVTPSGLYALTQPSATSRASAETLWSVAGSIRFDKAIMDMGFGHKTVSGRLAGTVGQGERGLNLDADFLLDTVWIGGRKITDLKGKLRKQPAGDLISVRKLLGRAHGGRIAGFAEIRLTDPVEYGISLEVSRIDLNKLFNATVNDPAKTAKVKGLLEGSLELIARGGAEEKWQATGVMRVSEARLYKMPVLLGLLHVIFLTLPGDSVFTDGTLTYHLRGGKLVFQEIHLSGPGLSLLGSGTMDMKTEELKLTFLAGPPGKVPSIAKLAAELLRLFAKELVEIRVVGTLTKPETRTVPLRSIETIIRTLLAPGKQAD